jgi:uncharacterized protein YjbI with pentapeptide repeats
MANADHIKRLRQGVDAWNAWRWRRKEPSVRPDLREADLTGANLGRADLTGADLHGANLGGADLHGANLGGANLSGAYLHGANLGGANLSGANLSGADFGGANLSGADLGGADLGGADLGGANLTGADLGGANLSGADLHGANFSGAYLHGTDLHGADLSGANLFGANLGSADLGGANLSGADLFGANLGRADLRQANLIDALLEHADLTGTKLWETQRGSWSIKAVICQRIFWDREGKEPTEYREGEFERIFAEKPRIVLNYSGGMSSIDPLTLPLVVERLQAEHPDSVLRVRSVQDDAGPAVPHAVGPLMTITVEDVEDRGAEAFAAEVEALPRIVLRYPGGISSIDLLALPLILERLQADHPGSVLKIRSVRNGAGGASVTITVEDVEDRGAEAFAAEVEALRGDLFTIQHHLCSEECLRLAIEAKYQAVVGDVLPLLLEKALPKQEFNIGKLTAPMIVEGPTMSRDTYNIPEQAGAVGPRAHAHDNTFQQVQSGIDLPKLAEELGHLREAMKGEATGTREQDKAIGAVADAEEAAAGGDGPAALRYLKSAGKWTLGVAEKIGVAVATETLKRAL